MEVACNLLNPQEVGPQEVLNEVHSLLNEINNDKKNENEAFYPLEIEKAYVTGFTEEEILDALFEE